MSFYQYFIYIFTCFLTVCCVKKNDDSLQIAAASSMQYALKELIEVFEKEKNVACNVVYGSSGKLTAQIQAQAPFDIFLSANNFFLTQLKVFKTKDRDAVTFAYGKLAIASTVEPYESLLPAISSAEAKKIALPNPKFAPYGIMAQDFLNSQAFEISKSKTIVYAENVMQANQYIVAGVVDLGFTSVSNALALEKITPNLAWRKIDTTRYQSLAQTAIVLSTKKETQLFVDFLREDKAQYILKKHGYGVLD